MNIKVLLLLLVFTQFLGGCRKDIDEISGGPLPVTFVKTAIYGIVTGSEGLPLNNVTVSSQDATLFTDHNGYFNFQDLTVDSKGAVVTFEAPGYFSLSKNILPNENDLTAMTVQLTPRVASGNFQADLGGQLLIHGAEMDIPANVMVNAANQPYLGPVAVYSYFLSPQSGEKDTRMPGNLMGIRENGQSAVLATFGILHFEFESNTGEPLQFSSLSKPTLKIPVDPLMLPAAPSTMPAWQYDSEKGRWLEKGTASLEGNHYLVEVDRAASWSVSIPFEHHTLSGKLFDPQNRPVASLQVEVSAEIANGIRIPANAFAIYNSENNGSFKTIVPKDVPLRFGMFTPCRLRVFVQDLPPIREDKILGNILVNLEEEQAIYLTGSLLDCQDMTLASPSYFKAVINEKAYLFPVDKNGKFEILLPKCLANHIKTTPVEFGKTMDGMTQTWGIQHTDVLNLGKIRVCEALEEFISFNLDGHEVIITENLEGRLESGDLMITGINMNQSGVMLLLTGQQPGFYQPTSINLTAFNLESGLLDAGICEQSCSGIEVFLSSVGSVGEPIIGTFSGKINYFPGNSGTVPRIEPFNGQFKVKRLL
jgi:hypothetical protein